MFASSMFCRLFFGLLLALQRPVDTLPLKPRSAEERLTGDTGSGGGGDSDTAKHNARYFTIDSAGQVAMDSALFQQGTNINESQRSPSVMAPRQPRPRSLVDRSLLTSPLVLYTRVAQHEPIKDEPLNWSNWWTSSLSNKNDPTKGGGSRGLLDVALACVLFAFAALAVNDWANFESIRQARSFHAKVIGSKEDSSNGESTISTPGRDAGQVAPTTAQVAHKWSAVGLVGLTAYRFYSGFLSATWLPYLLAMEGEDLWNENQSLFMGLAKLIYGLTILINPFMGRIGDRAVAIDHGLARRLFVRCGICISAVGIFVCLASAHAHLFYPFMFGILLWRLGEALNDVTLEAIIPEMVPPEQYQLAGSIKAASFLVGGLVGYVMLIVLVDLHYSWLYYAYFVGMFICATPAILLLGMEDTTAATARKRAIDESLWDSLWQAYVRPMQYSNGFPRFSLATFIFTLGTSPMFFLLLMVRDLIGVTDPVQLQRMFSSFSIVVFVSAAVASVLSGLGAAKRKPAAGSGSEASQDKSSSDEEEKVHKVQRWQQLVYAQIAFGIIVLLVPFVAWAGPTELKVKLFFFVCVLFGACFGSGYSRFQDATWQVLPTGDRGQANAMGFQTMCRLLGVGIGNFAAGLMLDFFYTGNALPSYHQQSVVEDWHGPEDQEDRQVYMTIGYVLMCVMCAIFNFISAAVTRSIIPVLQAEQRVG